MSMFSYTSKENLTVTELKRNVIKAIKDNRASTTKLWYDRYRKAGGKMTLSQLKK